MSPVRLGAVTAPATGSGRRTAITATQEHLQSSGSARNLVRRRELAEFLRVRRERLTPAEVGLVSYGRRKLVGLRRQEVADLASVGLAWYTWLEQARNINVSDEVLDAIARALRLNQDERGHLFALGRRASSASTLGAEGDEPEGLWNSQLAVLENLAPLPALIRDEHWNLLACNEVFSAITHIDDLPGGNRSLLKIVFTHQPSIELHPDWEGMAAFAVAHFRFECARRLQDPELRELVEELQDISPLFARLWRRHEVESGIGSSTTWYLPELGKLELQRVVYPLQSASDPALLNGPRYRMCTYVPTTGTDSLERLSELFVDAGALGS